MSNASDFNIDHVAMLARLALTDEEKARFSSQIGDILAYIQQLKEVDVSGVEPTAHAFPVENVWQEDVPVAGLPVAEVLRNAPESRDNMIVVPAVMD